MKLKLLLISLTCLFIVSCAKPYNPKYDEPCVTIIPEYNSFEEIYFSYKFEDENSIKFIDLAWHTVLDLSPKPSSYVIKKNPLYGKEHDKVENSD